MSLRHLPKSRSPRTPRKRAAPGSDWDRGPEPLVLDECADGESGDTSSEDVARRGHDVQGIPWPLLEGDRETHRASRVATYQSYNNCEFDAEALARDCCAVGDAQLYRFRYNARAPRPSVVHFQLRHLVHCLSRTAVAFACDNGVGMWCASARRLSPLLDARRAAAFGLPRVSVSSCAASSGVGLVAAGGFAGELLVSRLEAAAAPGFGGGGGGGGGGDGAAASPPPAAPPLLHAGRLSDEDNAITNHLLFCNAGGGGCDGDGGAAEPPLCGACGGGPALLCCNNDGVVRVVDPSRLGGGGNGGGGAAIVARSLRLPWAVNAAAPSPACGGGAGAALLAVGDDPTPLLLDLRAPGGGGGGVPLPGHRDYVFAAAWHPTRPFLAATGSQDATLRLWDVRAAGRGGGGLACCRGRLGAIRSLAFSPDGATLAAAEPADFVHLFDVDSLAAAGNAAANAANCANCAVVPRAQVIDLFGEVSGVAFSPGDGASLFVGVADVTYGSLLEWARDGPARAGALLL